MPEKPDSLEIKGAPNKEIQVNWTLPIHPNGPINHYCLYYRLRPEGGVSAPGTNASSPAGECIDDKEWTSLRANDTIVIQKFPCEDGAELLFYVHAVNRRDGIWLHGDFEDDEVNGCPKGPDAYGSCKFVKD